MRIRFLKASNNYLMEVWGDERMNRSILKEIYNRVYRFYEEGFSGRIKIEIDSDAGEPVNDLEAMQTYLIDDLYHAHPVAVRIMHKNQTIRRMALM